MLVPSSVKYYLKPDLLKANTQIPGNMSFVFILVLVVLYLILTDVKNEPLKVLERFSDSIQISFFCDKFHFLVFQRMTYIEFLEKQD